MSQKARFCESNAPSVITGLSLISDQWMASADWKTNNPPSPLLPPIALYFASGLQSGFGSLNGTKLCFPTPVQMMLFFFDTVEFEQPQFRLRPTDTVLAFGVTYNLM